MNAHDAARLLEAAAMIWLTRHEAAEHARVSVDTIDRWRKDGLRYTGGDTHGRKVTIRLDWLEKYMVEQRAPL